MLTRLTALEFQNAVMLDDVLVVLQRAELTTRMAEEIERDCVELGTEGRLIRMQLEELVGEVPREKAAVVYDYHAKGGVDATREGLQALSRARLPGPARVRAARGARLRRARRTRSTTPSQPRGLPRALPRPAAPRQRDPARRRASSADLEAIVRASQRDLEAVEGVGAVRARDIREGLRRLQEHNLVDRYLQL